MSLNIYNPTTQQLTEVAGLDVKDSLEKVATLPTPTADYLNQVYILVGTQEGYHVGSIYQCRYINSAYTWVEITGSVVGKADKAPNATNNHLAKLTADGNLADSGIAVGNLGTAINKNWTDLVRPNSHDLVESNAVYSAITNAISSIYTPHGDITCAELVPALLIEENIGNVYTVTDSGTTTAYFMQGAGKTINTGDSVSIIKAGEDTILFNLMGNVLDLTDYQKKNLSTAIEIGGVNKTTVEDALNGLNDHEEEDIEGIWKANNVLGAKNLLPNNGETNTRQGAVFTKNNDGSVTISTNEPTITNTWFMLVGLTNGDTSYPMVDGDYILSTTNSLPSGVQLVVKTDDGNTVVAQIDAGENKKPFTLSGNKSISVGIRVVQGTEITTPITIYPMIRLASDPDDTYVPYAMTNKQLTDNKVGWDSNSLIGVKNLNGTIYSTKTHYDIDFTANSDGTVTANGTSTGSAQDGNDTGAWFVAPFSAQVILSGGISTTAHIYPWDYTDDARPYADSTQTSRISSNTDADGTHEVSFYMIKGHSYGMVIRITNGTTVSNAIFKPLLRLASDPDNTYVPYAKTNQELSYNNFNESVVNITSYDTDSNKYVCPCDGYAYMYMGSTNGSGGFIYIYGATGTNRIQIGMSVAPTGTYPSFCTFVKKGMRLQTHDIVGGGKAYFRPLD